MSTAPLKKFWVATFKDGHTIIQPEDDRYSKHDDTADWNPSAFRDVLDYQEKSELVHFGLGNFGLFFDDGTFSHGDELFSLEEKPLKNRKLVYFREMRKEWHDGVEQEAYVNRYAIGYEGTPIRGGRRQKKIVFFKAG